MNGARDFFDAFGSNEILRELREGPIERVLTGSSVRERFFEKSGF